MLDTFCITSTIKPRVHNTHQRRQHDGMNHDGMNHVATLVITIFNQELHAPLTNKLTFNNSTTRTDSSTNSIHHTH